MARRSLSDLVVVEDRRGNGLRRYFGPFHKPGKAGEAVDRINKAARSEEAPKLPDGEPAIVATSGWIHPVRKAAPSDCVFDAPDPRDLIRPSER